MHFEDDYLLFCVLQEKSTLFLFFFLISNKNFKKKLFLFIFLSSLLRQRDPVGLILRKTSAWLELDSRTPSTVRLSSLPARKFPLELTHN